MAQFNAGDRIRFLETPNGAEYVLPGDLGTVISVQLKDAGIKGDTMPPVDFLRVDLDARDVAPVTTRPHRVEHVLSEEYDTGSPSEARWKVTVRYRSRLGYTATFYVEELEALAHVIEQGPDWNSIDSIAVELNRRSYHVDLESTEA